MSPGGDDGGSNGLADLVGGLIRANLERDPGRRGLLHSSVVELAATDAGVAATVRIARGDVEVVGVRADHAHLRIRASSGNLLELAAAPLLAGLPDPFRREGRAVLRKFVRGDVRVSGMLRHPVVLSRFSRLLSVR